MYARTISYTYNLILFNSTYYYFTCYHVLKKKKKLRIDEGQQTIQ